MRITESNMTLAWQWAHLRPDEPSASTRGADVKPALDPAAIAAANQLDTDHDGWLDEDDIPYDQLMRLARKAQEYAELGGVHLGAPAVITPAVITAAVITPAVTTPAVPTPAVTTPAVTTPAVTTPAVTTPASTGAGRPAQAEPKREERGGAPQIDLLA